MSEVRYLPVVGFPGYKVGDDGSVWSCWKIQRILGTPHDKISVMTDQWKQLKGIPDGDGRPMVGLYDNGKCTLKKIHTVVLEAFIGPRPDGHVACHFPDPDVTNNKLTNLRWDTVLANYNDAVIHGTCGPGELNGRATITEQIVNEIREDYEKLKITHKRKCRVLLYEKYKYDGVSMNMIQKIIYRKTWKHI